jgi:hypothetical protein
VQLGLGLVIEACICALSAPLACVDRWIEQAMPLESRTSCVGVAGAGGAPARFRQIEPLRERMRHLVDESFALFEDGSVQRLGEC